MSYISFENVIKEYNSGETGIRALDGASFNVEKGELAVILGASGAGKTTALNILGGMDSASSGTIKIDEKDLSSCSKKELISYRRTDIGFVFQFYNLIPNLTALENVELAAQVCRNHFDACLILDKVGMSQRKNNFPAQLSGGEQQRVSIARALAKNPKLLLCDEPTGALDSATGTKVLSLLKNTAKENNIALIIVTHNSKLEEISDKLIRLKDGKILSMEKNEHPKSITEVEW